MKRDSTTRSLGVIVAVVAGAVTLALLAVALLELWDNRPFDSWWLGVPIALTLLLIAAVRVAISAKSDLARLGEANKRLEEELVEQRERFEDQLRRERDAAAKSQEAAVRDALQTRDEEKVEARKARRNELQAFIDRARHLITDGRTRTFPSGGTRAALETTWHESCASWRTDVGAWLKEHGDDTDLADFDAPAPKGASLSKPTDDQQALADLDASQDVLARLLHGRFAALG